LWGGIGGLGHGDEAEQPRPKLVKALLDYGCRVAQVACGEKHTLILTDDGEVLTCGNGEYGRLGNGGSSDHATPEPVEFFDERCGTRGMGGKLSQRLGWSWWWIVVWMDGWMDG
jgi:alpha-tubulin suppressor-like RCC1 family protein